MKNKYIQPVLECDLNDILELQKKAFKEVAKVMDNYNIPPLLQTIDELKLEFNTNIILKYTNDKNQIVGSIRAYLDELNICHVGKLIVSPDCQNKGIGRRLMFEIESYFPQSEKFTLFTGKGTPNTLHLYQTVGYEIVEKKMINSIAMYIMEKQPKQQCKGMEEK